MSKCVVSLTLVICFIYSFLSSGCLAKDLHQQRQEHDKHPHHIDRNSVGGGIGAGGDAGSVDNIINTVFGGTGTGNGGVASGSGAAAGEGTGYGGQISADVANGGNGDGGIGGNVQENPGSNFSGGSGGNATGGTGGKIGTIQNSVLGGVGMGQGGNASGENSLGGIGTGFGATTNMSLVSGGASLGGVGGNATGDLKGSGANGGDAHGGSGGHLGQMSGSSFGGSGIGNGAAGSNGGLGGDGTGFGGDFSGSIGKGGVGNGGVGGNINDPTTSSTTTAPSTTTTMATTTTPIPTTVKPGCTDNATCIDFCITGYNKPGYCDHINSKCICTNGTACITNSFCESACALTGQIGTCTTEVGQCKCGKAPTIKPLPKKPSICYRDGDCGNFCLTVAFERPMCKNSTCVCDASIAPVQKAPVP